MAYQQYHQHAGRDAWGIDCDAGGLIVPFTPDRLSAVSAWLRVANATLVSGDISSLPDSLNTNPAVQTVAGRRPTLENSAGNALPCMRFATNDVLSWPITAQSSASSQAGWGLWVKPDGVATSQTFIRVGNNTGGANGTKLICQATNATLACSASHDGTTIKVNTTGNVLDTGWHFVTLEYDAAAGTDGAKITVTVDGAVQTPSITGTATLSTLFAATGNILIGNRQDAASASNQLDGLIGPNIYAFASKTAGATTGLMSTAERLALMAFERPT